MLFRPAPGTPSPNSALRRRKLREGGAVLLAAAMLLGGPQARSASPCGMSSSRQAFDVEGLKSELMVTALSCGAQDRYNAFIEKFRGDVTAQESILKRYFASAYGRAAQKEHDDYITQLANVQSERGLQAGTSFCNQRISMFDEVAALEGGDLGGYAEAKDIVQPAVYETCATPVLPASSGRVRHVRATGHGRHRGRRES